MRNFILLVLLLALRGGAATYYVATNGAAGAGSIGSPWSYKVALTNALLTGGDTVYIRGGAYTNAVYTYAVSGSATNSRISYLAYPGELPVLLEPYLSINAAFIRISGHQFLDPTTNRVTRGTQIMIYGRENILDGNYMDNLGIGVGQWETSTNSIVADNISYFTGYQDVDPDRGHGHHYYFQNRYQNQFVLHNVGHNAFDIGYHGYTEAGYLNGFRIVGNIGFNNGNIARDGLGDENFSISGFQPVIDFQFMTNFSYHSGTVPTNTSLSVTLGKNNVYNDFSTSLTNGVGTVAGNWIVGRGANYFSYWSNLTMLANTFVMLTNASVFDTSADPNNFIVISDPRRASSPWIWNSNNYFNNFSTPFHHPFVGSAKSFATWKTDTTFDANSTLVTSLPSTTNIFVTRHIYDTNKAFVTVYNFLDRDRVTLDVTGVFPNVSGWEIYDTQNPLGSPIASGTGGASTISLPMTNTAFATIYGPVRAPVPAGPRFGAFLFKQLSLAGAGPVISSVTASAINPTTEKITWTTDTGASSLVSYGTTNTTHDPTLVTSHSVTITGLYPGTLYSYSVTSTNLSGSSTSSSSSFTTSTYSYSGTSPSTNAAASLASVSPYVYAYASTGSNSQVVAFTSAGTNGIPRWFYE